MITIHFLAIVQQRLIALRAMEDSGITHAGILISASSTVLLNMGSCILLPDSWHNPTEGN